MKNYSEMSVKAAERLGAEAYIKGGDLSYNPFSESSGLYKAWVGGYRKEKVFWESSDNSKGDG